MRKFALALLLSGFALSANGAEPLTENDLFELNFETNLITPALPAKSAVAIKDNLEKLRSSLSRSGFKTTLVRNGEVILISVPCADLFAPNETEIIPQGRKLLDKLKLSPESKGKYKILITVHSDDTGEANYIDDLTAARSNAIDDYLSPIFERLDITSIPYGLGSDEPVKPNDSVLNRAANRRAEIYIIPLP